MWLSNSKFTFWSLFWKIYTFKQCITCNKRRRNHYYSKPVKLFRKCICNFKRNNIKNGRKLQISLLFQKKIYRKGKNASKLIMLCIFFNLFSTTLLYIITCSKVTLHSHKNKQTNNLKMIFFSAWKITFHLYFRFEKYIFLTYSVIGSDVQLYTKVRLI